MTVQSHPALALLVTEFSDPRLAQETTVYGVPVAEMTRAELVAVACALSRTAAAYHQQLLKRPPPLPQPAEN